MSLMSESEWVEQILCGLSRWGKNHVELTIWRRCYCEFFKLIYVVIHVKYNIEP